MLNRHKNWLVHKQTAYGKDFSNPFMVDNLPKIVGFLTHLASLVKSWLVQDQTVLGKHYSNLLIADSLLKTIWFINAPCYGNETLASPKANELTIPEQMATGKGTSNPLMAVRDSQKGPRSLGSSSSKNDEAFARLMVSELAMHNERAIGMKKEERLAFWRSKGGM
ncbi:hypothetical protein Tco_0828946 [Tanacetum coccineum]